MDLIREVLLATETERGIDDKCTSKYGEEAILYHYALAIEAGLLDGQVIPNESGGIAGVVAKKLTWAGHDFLDAARNDGIWEKAKGKIVAVGGAWTIEILKAVLTSITKQELGLTG